MDNFLNCFMSTEPTMTEVCAWQPFSLGSWSKASWAVGSVAALTDRAISTSSVCSLGFLLPRYCVLSFWIGSWPPEI